MRIATSLFALTLAACGSDYKPEVPKEQAARGAFRPHRDGGLRRRLLLVHGIGFREGAGRGLGRLRLYRRHHARPDL
jgi:hypothetical protein